MTSPKPAGKPKSKTMNKDECELFKITKKNLWQVYLLKCNDNSLYCGVTNNIESRIQAHNEGRGARYTRGRGPVSLVAASRKMSRSQTLKLELQVKKLPAGRKIAFLEGGRFTNESG